MTLVVAVSPMIAPTVGGIMTTTFGWHSIFIALAIVTSFILLGCYLILPEGRKPDLSLSLKPKPVLKNFLAVSKEPQFIVYCIAGGFASSATFAYIAGSSDVFINFYHTSEQEYGWIFAIIGAVIIGSTQLNHLLLRKYGSDQIVNAAMIFQTIVGLVLIIGTYFNWYDKTTLIIMIALFLAPHGLTNANTTALSLAPFSKNTGSAASLLGSFRMAMVGIISALVSAFHDSTPLPMIIAMVMTVVSGFVILRLGKTVAALTRKGRLVKNPQ